MHQNKRYYFRQSCLLSDVTGNYLFYMGWYGRKWLWLHYFCDFVKKEENLNSCGCISSSLSLLHTYSLFISSGIYRKMMAQLITYFRRISCNLLLIRQFYDIFPCWKLFLYKKDIFRRTLCSSVTTLISYLDTSD